MRSGLEPQLRERQQQQEEIWKENRVKEQAYVASLTDELPGANRGTGRTDRSTSAFTPALSPDRIDHYPYRNYAFAQQTADA